MPFFDMSLAELHAYKPERSEPADFDAFWQNTLEEAHRYPLNAQFERVDYGLRLVDTYDMTFAGYGGQPVKGWFVLPTRLRSRVLSRLYNAGFFFFHGKRKRAGS